MREGIKKIKSKEPEDELPKGTAGISRQGPGESEETVMQKTRRATGNKIQGTNRDS